MISFLEYLREQKSLLLEAAITGVASWDAVYTDNASDIDAFKTSCPPLYEAMKYLLDRKINLGGTEVTIPAFKVPKKLIKSVVDLDKTHSVDVCELFVGVTAHGRSERADATNFILDEFKRGPIQSSSNKKLFFYYGDITKAKQNFPAKSNYKLYAVSNSRLPKDDVITAQIKLSDKSVNLGEYVLENNQLVLKAVIRFRLEEWTTSSGGSEEGKSQKLKAKIKTVNAILGGSGNEITIENKDRLAEKYLKNVLERTGKKETDPEYLVYSEIFNISKNSQKTNKVFIDHFEFSEQAKKYIYNSNFGNVVSEVLVPMLLINNVRSFSNIKDLILEITGDKNFMIKKIEWPESSTNGFSDYNLFFADALNRKTKEEKKFAISAKYGDGHAVPFIPLTLSHLNEIPALNKKYKNDTLKKIHAALSSVESFISRGNMLFGTWIVGYTLLNNAVPSSKEIDDLKNLWNALNDTKKEIDFTKLPAYKLLKKKVESGPIKINPVVFPFSLTYFFEKIVVKHPDFRPDSDIAKIVKMWLTGEGEDFTQIKLLDEKANGYKVKISKPEKTDTKVHFTTKLGDGSNVFKNYNPLDFSSKQILKDRVLRQQGQAIGIEIK